MRKLNLIFVITLTLASVACGNSGNDGGGSGDEAEGVAALNGEYEGIATFFTNIRVVDLGSNTPPVAADCEGDISVEVDEDGAEVIVGEGTCFTPANFASYTIVADFVDEENFEGEISLLFSRVTHVVALEGSIEDDVLSATFAGRTPQVGSIVIDWDGEFEADLIDD